MKEKIRKFCGGTSAFEILYSEKLLNAHCQQNDAESILLNDVQTPTKTPLIFTK